MSEPFVDMLAVGGKSNSLGRTEEVVQAVLRDKTRLEELYRCLFVDEAWSRMRAADALEKVCRVHPEWLEPYIDRLLGEVAISGQPSLQWHLAQIVGEVRLSPEQKCRALEWLTERLQTTDVDWIVAANCMKALLHFVQQGEYPTVQLAALLKVQQGHHSKSVVKLATKLLERFEHA